MPDAELTCVIPVYNGAATLERAVDSVLAQTVPTDIVLADDASTDGSAELIERLCRHHAAGLFSGRCRMRALRLHRNCGQGSARNAGAGLARTPWIGFLDQDDEWLPGFAEACLQALRHRPSSALARTQIEFCDLPPHLSDALEADTPALRREAITLTVPWNLVIHRAAFWAAGGFPNDAAFRGPLASEDHALSNALIAHFNTELLSAPLVRHRWRAGNALDRYLSRTRVVGSEVVFDEVLPEEASGQLQDAVASHASSASESVQTIRRLLEAAHHVR